MERQVHIRRRMHGKTEHMLMHMPMHIIIARVCLAMLSASVSCLKLDALYTIDKALSIAK